MTRSLAAGRTPAAPPSGKRPCMWRSVVLVASMVALSGCARPGPRACSRRVPATPAIPSSRANVATTARCSPSTRAATRSRSIRPSARSRARYRLATPDHAEDVQWRLHVQSNAGLTLDVTPPYRRVGRWGRSWAERLVVSVGEFSCKPLEWLRWEAQNRGLLVIGAPEASESAGAEAQLPHAPAHGPEIAALVAQRQGLPLYVPIVRVAASSVLVVLGGNLVAAGAVLMHDGCETPSYGTGAHCEDRDYGRVVLSLGGVASVLGVLGAAMSIPQLVQRRNRLRQIDDQLQQLRSLQVGLQGAPGGLGLALHSRF